MQNFVFYNPVKIIFGEGQISELASEIPQESRVLITYGGGSIKKNGVYDKVVKALSGYQLFEFDGIEPNPKFETLMRAVELARKEHINYVLAVGGGSVIDGTKFIVAAVDYAGDPWEIVFKKEASEGMSSASVITSALPFGTVLTLPAAGSEMNCGAVISRADSEIKLPFRNPLVFPKFSILDPTTTYTLPSKQTANGIIDAYVHVVEQYLTYPADAPFQDRFAEGLMQTLIEEAPIVMQDGNNYAARANIMWCSTMALNGLLATGNPQDWATHLIGHEITAKYGLDHGQTLAIVLPSLMTVKQQQKREKLVQYAERIWGINDADVDAKITKAINKTREFFESLGIQTRLSDYGISVDGIEPILQQLNQHGMTALGEHGDITLEVSKEILQRSI